MEDYAESGDEWRLDQDTVPSDEDDSQEQYNPDAAGDLYGSDQSGDLFGNDHSGNEENADKSTATEKPVEEDTSGQYYQLD